MFKGQGSFFACLFFQVFSKKMVLFIDFIKWVRIPTYSDLQGYYHFARVLIYYCRF